MKGTSKQPLLPKVERSQPRWVGHLIRMLAPRGAVPGTLTGQRPQGRPRTPWRAYITQQAWEFLGIPLKELESVSRGFL